MASKSGFRKINIYLDEENAAFVEWLAKRDNVKFQEELRMIFWTEFEQLQVLYQDEAQLEAEAKILEEHIK